mgnify:CR=1 FL=1
MATRIHKGYKFRIYPEAEQQVFFAKSFGCNRFIWNHFLAERQQFYLENKDKTDGKRSLNYYDNAAGLVKLKKQDATSWLTEVYSQCLQAELKQLDSAYIGFFKGITKYPRFKSKSDKQSCKFPQGFSLEGGNLWAPKQKKPIKMVMHREFGANAEILTVTVSKTKTGKYFAAFCVEEDAAPLPKSDKSVGIDLGLTDFATLSDGMVIKNPKIAWKQRKRLSFLQRRHSKKVKGSKNKEKARVKLAKCHEKITAKKQDFTHKLSRRIVDENQVIAVEDLNVVGMMKNRRLARSIGEVSWSEFTRQLEYKSEWAGRSFVQIGRFFPSSKLCQCGHVNQGLKLSDRVWQCPKCNAMINRDANAATNILRQGLNLLSEQKEKAEGKLPPATILAKPAKASKAKSGEGLPSDSKQKLKEASKGVLAKAGKSRRVYELRSPGKEIGSAGFQTGE